MANEAVFAPGAVDAETEALRRKYALAQELQKPLANAQGGQMVSGHFVANPWQEFADVFRAYKGKEKEANALEQYKGLGERRVAERSSLLADALKQMQGAPAFEAAGPAPQGAPQDGGYVVPAMKPDLMGGYSRLAGSTDPQLQAMGLHGIQQIPAMQQQAELKREAMAQQASENALNRQAREDQIRLQLQGQQEMRQLMAGQKQAQIIDTDQGKMRMMPNGTLAPLMDVQGNAISGPKGPQGTLARQNEAQQALNAIKQAETILPNATSSGLGSAVDQTAAFFGKSTTGAQNAAKLKAIEGDLVSKMPKMSGPQSDKDVAMYKQMAGVVGDATQPVATRQAALQAVKEIQQRYAGPTVNLGATGNPNSVMNKSGGGNIDSLLDKYK